MLLPVLLSSILSVFMADVLTHLSQIQLVAITLQGILGLMLIIGAVCSLLDRPLGDILLTIGSSIVGVLLLCFIFAYFFIIDMPHFTLGKSIVAVPLLMISVLMSTFSIFSTMLFWPQKGSSGIIVGGG